MPYCTRCKIDFEGDVGFCPYCGSPLIKKDRSFVGRTAGGPGGFKPAEVPEYLSRKLQALLMFIFGALLIGATIAYNDVQPVRPELLWGGIVSGGLLVLYGWHWWNKITHIMWTRQALREYGVPSITIQEVPEEPPPKMEKTKEEEIKDKLRKLKDRLIKGEIDAQTYNDMKSELDQELEKMKVDREKLAKKIREEEIAKKEEAKAEKQYKELLKKYEEKGYVNPGAVLRVDIRKKMEKGITREQAVEELTGENE